MALPSRGRRKLVLDGKVYFALVSSQRPNQAGNVPIAFVAHIEGNDNAKLVVRGVTSRSYWHDYPDDLKFLEGRVSIAPKSMVSLIRHYMAKGWNPEGSKPTNFVLDNEQLREILESKQHDRE